MLILVLQVSAASRYSQQIIMYGGLILQELGVSEPILSVGRHIRKFDHPGTGKCGWRLIIAAPPAFRNFGVTQSS
jgi:hypothetical protein